MFNYKKLKIARQRAKHNLEHSKFHQFINEDLLTRLDFLKNQYKNILIISNSNWLYNNLVSKYPNVKLVDFTDHDFYQETKTQYDLIIFPFAFHWIAEVPKFLVRINQILGREGIFLGNFASSGSLINLRKLLITYESEESRPHTPHISPLIQFEQISDIFKASGFTETIIDLESIGLEYKTPLNLMKELKLYGDSNALEDHLHYSITKNIYQKLKKYNNEELFLDQINLSSFISSKSKGAIKLF